MDRQPDLSAPLESRYHAEAPGVVEFRFADLAVLAVGTCLEANAEFIEVDVTDDWKKRGTMGP